MEGQAFGKKSVDGVWDALKRGSKAGAATSIVDNVYGALTAGKNGGGLSAGTGMLGLVLNHGISQAMNRDPKTACGSSSPFSGSLNFNVGYGYQKGNHGGSGRNRSQTRNGWSLENAIKDVVNDTIWGGLGSVAQYAGGTFFEAVGNSIFGRSKSGKKTVTSTLGNEIDITPSSNHTSVNKNPGPFGEANTSVDILDADGTIKTRRWYDSNGKAYRDVDMSDHGNPKEHPEVPHEHTWEYNNGKPKRN